MGAVDVSGQVRAWALAEVEKQCFGEDFSVDVGRDAVPMPGGVQVGYRIVISRQSPLLGQGPLFSLAPLLTPQPTAEQVGEAVTTLLRNLRDLSAQMLRKPAPSTA